MFDASAYISVPFAEKGRDHSGCDCWGLVWLIYKEQFGIILPSYIDDYEDTNDLEKLACLMAEGKTTWQEVPRGQEQYGDVVLIKFKGLPIHVGVILKRGLIMHIHEGIDATVEDYRRFTWDNRIVGFFRHKELQI